MEMSNIKRCTKNLGYLICLIIIDKISLVYL